MTKASPIHEKASVPSGRSERCAAGRPADLRRAFDQSFARAPEAAAEAMVDLVAIRVAGDPYALRIAEISGLAADRKIVPLPSRRAEVIGIATIRGSLISVYSLASLLGYDGNPAPMRWLAVTGVPGTLDQVGFGFAEFEGFLRLRRTDIFAIPPSEASIERGEHLSDLVRIDATTRPVVSTVSIMAALKKER